MNVIFLTFIQDLVQIKIELRDEAIQTGLVVIQQKPDDRILMKRISRNDNSALSELYDRYATYVHSLAIAIVGDRQTAEEITQDVFTRMW